jgi:hypothetical protein
VKLNRARIESASIGVRRAGVASVGAGWGGVATLASDDETSVVDTDEWLSSVFIRISWC